MNMARRLLRDLMFRTDGDVPGWVLITLMTAGLVTVLWGVAGPKLSDILSGALDSVKGPSGG